MAGFYFAEPPPAPSSFVLTDTVRRDTLREGYGLFQPYQSPAYISAELAAVRGPGVWPNDGLSAATRAAMSKDVRINFAASEWLSGRRPGPFFTTAEARGMGFLDTGDGMTWRAPRGAERAGAGVGDFLAGLLGLTDATRTNVAKWAPVAGAAVLALLLLK